MGAERHVSVGDTIGTIAYTAPETLHSNLIQKPSDVFAFGVLCKLPPPADSTKLLLRIGIEIGDLGCLRHR